MLRRDDTDNRLELLRQAVEEMGQFGQNTTVTRVQDLIRGALDGTLSTDRIRPLASDFDTIVEARVADRSEGFMFGNAVDEITAKLIELYDERIQSLEIANVEPKILEEALSRAREYVTRNRPYLRIDMKRFADSGQLMDALRRTIDHIASQRKSLDERLSGGVSPEHHHSPHFRWVTQCHQEHQTVGPIRWKPGFVGLILEEQRCVSTICEAVGWEPGEKERGAMMVGRTGGGIHCEWVQIWVNGSPDSKPPTDLPKFDPVPWTKDMAAQLPVFEDGVKATLNDPWGWQKNPTTPGGPPRFHEGIDIGCPAGTSVLSVSGGKVLDIRSGATLGEGVGLWIAEGGTVRMYWHVDPGLMPGDTVMPGQAVGTCYDWNNPGKNHMHFEIHKPPSIGTPFDPNTLTPGTSMDPLK